MDSRYADRTETEIKVYSNQSAVTLYVDGAEAETLEADKVFRFRVKTDGEHSIEARAGTQSDVMTIRKVETPNPDYRKEGGGGHYCQKEDYLCYSAPVTDLSDWRCDGVIRLYHGWSLSTTGKSEAGRKLGEIAVVPAEGWTNFETAIEPVCLRGYEEQD